MNATVSPVRSLTFSLRDPVRDEGMQRTVMVRVERQVAIRRTGRVLAIANQKGGVGKTTTAINLGRGLSGAGARVLVIEMDAQANLATGVGIDVEAVEATTYEVISPNPAERVSILDAMYEVDTNLWVVPGHLALASIGENGNGPGGEMLLARAVRAVADRFDMIIIDCPPNLGRLTISGLAAAHGVLVPVKCGPFELDGLAQLAQTVDTVRVNGLSDGLEITAVVATMYDGRRKVDQDVVGVLAEDYPQTYVPRPIRHATRAIEAAAAGEPLQQFAPSEDVSADYDSLAYTMAERMLA